MDAGFIRQLLKEAVDLGALSVLFTGGEPLLRDDFQDLYLFARRLGLAVTIYTNARKVTPELAALFSRIPPGRPIEVSVYGMRADSYNAVACRAGAFEEFWRGITLLQKYKIPFIVKQSLLPPNLSEMAEFESWAGTLAAMRGRPVYTMNYDLRSRRDNPVKDRQIISLRMTPGETVAVLARNPDYAKTLPQFCGRFIGPPGNQLFRCGAGKGLCVDAYGKAQMCMALRHPGYVYDLHNTTGAEEAGVSPLKFVLTQVFPEWRKLKAVNPEYLRRCARCFLHGLCEQCPGRSWAEHGTLDTPVEYLCEIAHAEARFAGLLHEGEKGWEVKNWRYRINRLNDAAQSTQLAPVRGV